MNSGLRHLATRIRNELIEINQTISRSEEGLKRALSARDEYYLDGAALNLHSFYSGLERIFELIAIHVDDKLPKGENWHQVLLQQMTEELADIRPAVISDSNRQGLEEFRGFRHVVRNVYSYKFDPGRIEKLVEKAKPLFVQLRAELLAFADFLEVNAEG